MICTLVLGQTRFPGLTDRASEVVFRQVRTWAWFETIVTGSELSGILAFEVATGVSTCREESKHRLEIIDRLDDGQKAQLQLWLRPLLSLCTFAMLYHGTRQRSNHHHL